MASRRIFHSSASGSGTTRVKGAATTRAVAFMAPRVSNPSSLIFTIALTPACSSADSRTRRVAATSGDTITRQPASERRSGLLPAAQGEEVVRHPVVTRVHHLVVHGKHEHIVKVARHRRLQVG